MGWLDSFWYCVFLCCGTRDHSFSSVTLVAFTLSIFGATRLAVPSGIAGNSGGLCKDDDQECRYSKAKCEAFFDLDLSHPPPLCTKSLAPLKKIEGPTIG
jgi:hypothetical protein